VVQTGARQHRVDGAGQPGERGQRRRRGEQHPVGRPGPAQRPHRRQPREQVPEPQRPQDQDYGHELSTDGVITSSRTSQPGGWRSANSTASATFAGSLSFASAGGLYFSSRSSKNAVCMPPGTSMVTPTVPCSSAASARVKPTTPNFEAQ